MVFQWLDDDKLPIQKGNIRKDTRENCRIPTDPCVYHMITRTSLQSRPSTSLKNSWSASLLDLSWIESSTYTDTKTSSSTGLRQFIISPRVCKETFKLKIGFLFTTEHHGFYRLLTCKMLFRFQEKRCERPVAIRNARYPELGFSGRSRNLMRRLTLHVPLYFCQSIFSSNSGNLPCRRTLLNGCGIIAVASRSAVIRRRVS